MVLQGPWALFIVTDKVSNEWISQAIVNANNKIGNKWWQLWVASDKHENEPVLGPNNEIPDATVMPISNDFRSPWVGKSLKDCAAWLDTAPDVSAVCKGWFVAVMDYSSTEDTFLVCRYKNSAGKVTMEGLPVPSEKIINMIIIDKQWEEDLFVYGEDRKRDGKPDRRYETAAAN